MEVQQQQWRVHLKEGFSWFMVFHSLKFLREWKVKSWIVKMRKSFHFISCPKNAVFMTRPTADERFASRRRGKFPVSLSHWSESPASSPLIGCRWLFLFVVGLLNGIACLDWRSSMKNASHWIYELRKRFSCPFSSFSESHLCFSLSFVIPISS